MLRLCLVIGCCLLWPVVPNAFGQFGATSFSTFGYFQGSFQYQVDVNGDDDENTFSVQQLNLILESNLSRRWRAFIDFEVLNNFSSSRRWGSFDLNEAWVRYRANPQVTLKVGLHVPVFNHLNDIKNRTPLLPYVIRPHVYEESFGEVLNIEEYLPERAFGSVSGFWPVGRAKLDYNVYIGNSPNIRSQFDTERQNGDGQTGVDTTTTVLVGGRLGVRYGELTLGGSVTRETVNFFRNLEAPLGAPARSLSSVPKTRLGADLSMHLKKLSFEGEVIVVRYHVDPPRELPPRPGRNRPRIDLDRVFYYGTLGYHLTDKLFAYGSYWFSEEGLDLQTGPTDFQDELDVNVFTAGLRYTLLRDEVGFDRVTLKAQHAYVLIKAAGAGINQFGNPVNFTDKPKLHLIGLGVSVLF